MSGSTTSAPDYTGAAQQQAQSQQDMNAQQTWANRPNQNTPWGSTSWQAALGTDPATGAPITNWTQNQTLDPTLQNALNSQINIQGNRTNVAQGMLGRVAQETASPFNWGAMPQAGGNVGPNLTQGNAIQGGIDRTTGTTNEPGFNAQRDQLFQSQMNRMMPLQQQAQASQDTRLANMGFDPNSEAYKRQQTALTSTQSADRFNALNNATSQQQALQSMLLGQQQQAFGQNQAAGAFANAAAGQQFGQNLQGNAQNYGQQMQSQQRQDQMRQQAIAEQAQARGMSLNELNALMNGQQVASPQMPGVTSAQGGQAPNYLAAATAQGNYNTANQSNWGAGLGGIASLIGTLA